MPSDHHLIPIHGGTFSAWRVTALRGAGFPARTVLGLAAPRSSAVADSAIDATSDPGQLAELNATLAAERIEVGRFLRGIASDSRFREAIAWQNRKALVTGVDVLRRTPVEVAKASVRQKERLVATYLQRYCAKNETAGFFGPMGWARFEREHGFWMTPGRGLLAERITYLETWCIDALATRLAARWDMRPWLRPRLVPYGYLDGAELHLPFAEAIRLPPLESRVIALCDGDRTAMDIAELVLREPSATASSQREVLDALTQAQTRGAILWDLHVPFGFGSARALRGDLQRVEDDVIRAQALAALDELESAAQLAHRSAGDADATCAALEQLENTFGRLTGASATRSEGAAYAGRTVLYQDSRRDLELRIGAQVLERIGPALSLTLMSARWYTHEIARRVRDSAHAVFDGLAIGQPRVALLPFYAAFTGSEAISRAVGETRGELKQRWGEVLGDFREDAREVRFRSEDLLPRVHEIFDAPGPGWSLVRHVSPDLMIAAASAAAIARGDHRVVLGEIHVGNMLASATAVMTHPHKQELFDAIRADLGDELVLPVVPRHVAGSVRLDWELVPESAVRFLASPDSVDVPHDRLVTVGELVVENRAGDLVVQTRDGRRSFNLVEFLGLMLLNAATTFDFVPARGGHEPRLLFDELVVRRERWRFDAADVGFARVQGADARFLAARRFRREHGLPRFVFARASIERKPYWIDFDSPILLDVLAKLVRAASEASSRSIVLTEMLPDFDDLWLEDAEGKRYTSELRVVTLDQAAPSLGRIVSTKRDGNAP